MALRATLSSNVPPGRESPGGATAGVGGFSCERRFYKGILEVDLDKNKYQPTPGTYEVGGLGKPGNKFPEGGRISPSKRPYHLDDEQKRSAAVPGHKYNIQQSISKDVEGGYWMRSHPKNDGMRVVVCAKWIFEPHAFFLRS